MDSNVKITFRKTRKGKINKIVEEVYLREDIEIPLLANSEIATEKGLENIIYVIDTEAFVHQIDLIENCPILNNVLVLQTILEELRQKDQKIFENVKNLIEIETHRNFYVFANEYAKQLYSAPIANESTRDRNERAIIRALKWLQEQAALYKKRVVYLTNSPKPSETAKANGIESQTIFDFIHENCKDMPDLLDYLGFASGGMEIEDESEGNGLFEKHIPQADAVAQVKKGELFEGKLSIARDNKEEGRLYLGKYGIEIKIFGLANLNRALHGDRIAVEILPEKEWKKINFAELSEDVAENEIEEEVHEGHFSESNSTSLKSLFEKIKKLDLTPTGKVVSVLKRVSRNFCGNLKPLEHIREETGDSEIREFIPADSRYPNFFLKIRNNGALDNKKIIFKFDQWSINSKLPQGHFVSIIGDIGDAYTEGNVILLEHNVEIKNFSKAVYECLPSEGENWQIPKEEYEKRTDFRGTCVCSIDPPGCKDIDDALHCKLLPNGNFQVGVHIADVTYFVRPDTAIDLEAANRCTTVYLVGRRTDMLPKLLTETLCSLKSQVERLTFSVIWEITQNGEVVSADFMKGIIKSRAALTYAEAQKIIDDSSDNSELAQSIRGLNKLARIFRKKRIDAGALTLASTQLKFSFSDETHNPTDVSLYNLVETNYLVEEFMLLANIYVAEKTLYHFPSNSILRKHSTPKPKQIKELGKLLTSLGYNLDYSSSKNLADSLDRMQRTNDEFFNKLVRILTTRTMNEANYFCTANVDYPEFRHYGLACSAYTHFTSPIRRYADVLVHRLLAAAIDIESLPKTMCNKQRLTKISDKMNMRHRNARNASRASSDYHTYLFFRGKVLEEEAIVMNISYNGFSVILPKYGLEGFIQLSQEDENAHQARLKKLLESDADQIINDVYLNGVQHKIFDHILVKISVELEHFHKKINVDYLKKL